MANVKPSCRPAVVWNDLGVKGGCVLLRAHGKMPCCVIRLANAALGSDWDMKAFGATRLAAVDIANHNKTWAPLFFLGKVVCVWWCSLVVFPHTTYEQQVMQHNLRDDHREGRELL